MRVGTVQKRVIVRHVVILGLCVAFGWFLKAKLTPPAPSMGMMGAGEPLVLTQVLETRNIAPKKTYIGHVEPIKSVNLMPQITGYVEKVLFEEGSLVQEGDILFVIEQERYIANVSLREAELASAKANLVRAERDYKRQSSLSKQNYASKATLDNAESAYLQAKAAVSQAQANLDLAKINLGYTEIKAPISGRIGKALITEGNSDTATIAVYAEYNNDKDLLIPGNYVDIRIGNKDDQLALLVPQGAIAQDQHGNYVMIVTEAGVAEQRRVELGEIIEDKQVVLSGLSADDKVIIQGLQKVRDGQKVKAQLVSPSAEVK